MCDFQVMFLTQYLYGTMVCFTTMEIMSQAEDFWIEIVLLVHRWDACWTSGVSCCSSVCPGSLATQAGVSRGCISFSSPPDSVCATNKVNLIEATRPDTSYMSSETDEGAATSDSGQLKDYTVLQSLGRDWIGADSTERAFSEVL